MKTKLVTLLLALTSWGAYAQHDHAGNDEKKVNENIAMFKDEKLGNAYAHYIHIKDALVTSNADEAKKAAEDLLKSLAGVSNSKMVSEETTKISASSDINDQRKAFASLSSEMTVLVKGQLSTGTIYIAYCPMANGGSSWLSNEKEIKNPYFGNRMLRCGSINETIQ